MASPVRTLSRGAAAVILDPVSAVTRSASTGEPCSHRCGQMPKVEHSRHTWECSLLQRYKSFLMFQAYARRFPKCPLIPVFVDSEILNQSESKDGSVVVTERRCTIDIEAPRLLKRVCLIKPLTDQKPRVKHNSWCYQIVFFNNPVFLFVLHVDCGCRISVFYAEEHAEPQRQDASHRGPQ
ncbi:hypothetical protein GOODEAATRI_024522 [Goodea atripinnis]|uniref:PRELI/MSF1 domain-containing protein n=1 Tax=Goodea atripinnis TaxID=208336 RepID=A0ABV0PRB1_9TELE